MKSSACKCMNSHKYYIQRRNRFSFALPVRFGSNRIRLHLNLMMTVRLYQMSHFPYWTTSFCIKMYPRQIYHTELNVYDYLNPLLSELSSVEYTLDISYCLIIRDNYSAISCLHFDKYYLCERTHEFVIWIKRYWLLKYCYCLVKLLHTKSVYCSELYQVFCKTIITLYGSLN